MSNNYDSSPCSLPEHLIDKMLDQYNRYILCDRWSIWRPNNNDRWNISFYGMHIDAWKLEQQGKNYIDDSFEEIKRDYATPREAVEAITEIAKEDWVAYAERKLK